MRCRTPKFFVLCERKKARRREREKVRKMNHIFCLIKNSFSKSISGPSRGLAKKGWRPEENIKYCYKENWGSAGGPLSNFFEAISGAGHGKISSSYIHRGSLGLCIQIEALWDLVPNTFIGKSSTQILDKSEINLEREVVTFELQKSLSVS